MLDCPPSLGPVSVNALVAADRVIVPVQAEYLALEGLVQFLDTLGMIRRELNPSLNVSGLLITMHDERTRLAQDVERELRDHFPQWFRNGHPPQRQARRGPSYGLPVTEHAPSSRGSVAYRALAEEVSAAWLAPGSAAASPRSCRRPRVRTSASCTSFRVDLIKPNPNQPRKRFDAETLSGLASSIEACGVVQPLLVRPLARRQLRADRGRAPLARRPAGGPREGSGDRPRVRAAERLQVALIENVVREDLNPIDEARACAALVEDLGLSKEELARRIGRSRPAVSNLIRLLELPDEALALLESGELTEGHGRALLGIRGNDARRRLARDAANGGWSVRETENRVKLASQPNREPRPEPVDAERQAALRDIGDELESSIGHEVRVRPRGEEIVVEIQLSDLAETLDLARRLGKKKA